MRRKFMLVNNLYFWKQAPHPIKGAIALLANLHCVFGFLVDQLICEFVNKYIS